MLPVTECERFLPLCAWNASADTRVDLRGKLVAIHKSSSPRKRPLHVHATCAIVRIPLLKLCSNA